MTNHVINPNDYSEELRKLLTTDPAHADIFNPLFERLINNDAFQKALIERLIQEHDHSGEDGKGSKIPFANIDVPAEEGGLVTDADLAYHINERNPHGSRPSDIGAPTKQEFDTLEQKVTEHSEDLVKHGVYGVATGTNSLTMTLENVTTYPVGMLVAFKNTTANTGAVTLNINGLGGKSIRKANGSTLSPGNLKAGGVYQCRFDGTNFMLLGEGGEYGTAVAGDVLEGKTIGTENGLVTGTLELGYKPGDIIPFVNAGITKRATPMWSYTCSYQPVTFEYKRLIKADRNGDVFYTQATGSILHKINGKTGTLIWETDYSVGNGDIAFDMDNDVYVLSKTSGVDPICRKINGKTGALIWETTIAHEAWLCRLLIAGGNNFFLFSPRNQGCITGVSKNTGNVTIPTIYAGAINHMEPDDGGIVITLSGNIYISYGNSGNGYDTKWEKRSNSDFGVLDSYTYPNYQYNKFIACIGEDLYYSKNATSPTITGLYKNKDVEVIVQSLPFSYRNLHSTPNQVNISHFDKNVATIMDAETGGIFQKSLPGLMIEWIGPDGEVIEYVDSSRKIRKYSPFGVLVR